jgi:hypothetical protein
MTERAFICDTMVGRLAKSLRMLGFDTLYARTARLDDLAATAARESRTLLTRRTTLLQKPPAGISCLFICKNDPAEQLREVFCACGLTRSDVRPFTRCLRCNARLAPVEKHAAGDRMPDHVAATLQTFTACPACGRVYWKGTHYERMLRQCSDLPSAPDMQ